ncbi:MAG: hypothetical protein J7518_22475 [Nocardioidaceae bacterium]|nr:hypothetical protein [Nocardioidaceae bacterium]
MLAVLARRAGRGLGYGLLVGLGVGVLARTMMRAVALAAGEETGFSLGISLAIVGMLTVVTLPGALMLGLWQGRGRWVAVGVSAVLVVGVHLPEAAAVLTGDEAAVLSTGRWLLLGAVLAVWVAGLALLLRCLARWTRVTAPAC